MPNQVDALIQRVQPTDRESMLYRVLSQSHSKQLPSRNHPMLPSR
jgi:hypothetical protein